LRDTKSIRIRAENHIKLRMIAAMQAQTIQAVIDTLVEREAKRLKVIYKPKGGE